MDTQFFSLKLDQDWILDYIMTDKDAYEMFIGIMDPNSPVGAILNTLSAAGNENAAKILQIPKMYFNYFNFF